MFEYFEDDSEEWFRDVFENHLEEARARAFSLLDGARRDEKGCLVTDTVKPRKARFRARQLEAYRFIHCVLTKTAASRDHFVRHRCHDRSCINPEHLQLGSAADNKHDDWAHWASEADRK